MKDEIFSKKITIINFILSLLVVILHANCSSYITAESTGILKNVFIVARIIGDIAVPTFFMMSSYLFFRNFKIEKYKEKLIKRVHSLIIPYLFWSIACWAMYAIIAIIPQLSKLLNQSNFSFLLIEIVKSILLAKYNPPIWFIRTLFGFVLIAPIIYYTIKKLKKYSLIIPIFFIILNIFVKFSYAGATSLIFWLPIFYIGSYLAINKRETIEKEKFITKNRKLTLIITTIIYIIVVAILIKFDEKSKIYYMYRIISPLFIWILSDYFKLISMNIKSYMKDTFFIFCTHYPIITAVKRILIKLIGNSEIKIFVVYILSIIITLIIILILAKIIKKYFNKLWIIINGKRA